MVLAALTVSTTILALVLMDSLANSAKWDLELALLYILKLHHALIMNASMEFATPHSQPPNLLLQMIICANVHRGILVNEFYNKYKKLYQYAYKK